MQRMMAQVFASEWLLALLAFYVVASSITFVLYAMDKSAAKNDRRRTPEKTLQLLSLAGGWPGALIAQRLLRHKTRKQPFQLIFWLAVMFNCGLLGWLLF